MKLALVEKNSSADPDPEDKSKEDGSRMSFLEHLDELRRRLLMIVVYAGAGFLVCFGFHRQVYHFIAAPILPFLPGKQLAYTGVTDPILFDMKVCFIPESFLHPH
jgi:sec-independent protein translocase protein TatC